MERKVLSSPLKAEGMDRRHEHSGLGSRNLIRIYFFFRKSGILKRKLAVSVQIWNGACLVLDFLLDSLMKIL